MTDRPTPRILVFNGVDGSTGRYLTPPMAPETLAQLALGETWDARHLNELQARDRRSRQPDYALEEGRDPKDLARAGWGVIFPAGANAMTIAAIREALAELLALRRSQAGDLYREYAGGDGYRRGETKSQFLER